MTSSTSPEFFDKDGVPIRFKKRKARFTFSEVHILLDEVRKHRHIVVGKFNYGVPATVKKRTWAEITARINEIGECEREVVEVIKKWADLKCETTRKVAAVRTGFVSFPGSRYLRDFSPTENIVRQILELDSKKGGGRRPGSGNRNGKSTAKGSGEDDDGAGEEDDDMDIMPGMGLMPSSPETGEGDGGVGTGAMDSPSTMPPPLERSSSTPVPSTSAMSTPPPLPGSKDTSAERESVFDSSGDLSEDPFEMSFEMPIAEDSSQQVDSDGDQRDSSRPSTSTPTPAANAGPSNSNARSSAGAVHRSKTLSLPLPSSSSSAPPPASVPSPCVQAPERGGVGIGVGVCGVDVGQAAVMSVQEQHMSTALLETVSRSLELLSESVQQLAETQQEFARESLQLQRDTVQVLRDFATGAMTLMHDKLNGRPAL